MRLGDGFCVIPLPRGSAHWANVHSDILLTTRAECPSPVLFLTIKKPHILKIVKLIVRGILLIMSGLTKRKTKESKTERKCRRETGEISEQRCF